MGSTQQNNTNKQRTMPHWRVSWKLVYGCGAVALLLMMLHSTAMRVHAGAAPVALAWDVRLQTTSASPSGWPAYCLQSTSPYPYPSMRLLCQYLDEVDVTTGGNGGTVGIATRINVSRQKYMCNDTSPCTSHSVWYTNETESFYPVDVELSTLRLQSIPPVLESKKGVLKDVNGKIIKTFVSFVVLGLVDLLQAAGLSLEELSSSVGSDHNETLRHAGVALMVTVSGVSATQPQFTIEVRGFPSVAMRVVKPMYDGDAATPGARLVSDQYLVQIYTVVNF